MPKGYTIMSYRNLSIEQPISDLLLDARVAHSLTKQTRWPPMTPSTSSRSGYTGFWRASLSLSCTLLAPPSSIAKGTRLRRVSYQARAIDARQHEGGCFRKSNTGQGERRRKQRNRNRSLSLQVVENSKLTPSRDASIPRTRYALVASVNHLCWAFLLIPLSSDCSEAETEPQGYSAPTPIPSRNRIALSIASRPPMLPLAPDDAADRPEKTTTMAVAVI